MDPVTAQWQRIEAHLQSIPSLSTSRLNPGASEEEIAAAESAMGGLRFPEDFRSSLRRHNGQEEFHALLGMGNLLSTEQIVIEWSVWTELLDAGDFDDNHEDTSPDDGIKCLWWNARWIPVTSSGGGDNDCLDMDPAEGGTVGQVIQMWHEEGPRARLATSFLAWLTECADKLEDKSLVWEDDVGFVEVEIPEAR